jgi:hypothetical protein
MGEGPEEVEDGDEEGDGDKPSCKMVPNKSVNVDIPESPQFFCKVCR